MSATVIIGAGHAGIQLADSLRTRGHDRPITLLSAESELPYQRPPLSKDYLAEGDPQPLPLRGAEFYHDHEIDLRRGTAVTGIDPRTRTIGCADGTRMHYDDLVLAAGSRNRRLTLPSAQGPGVHYLRTAADAALLHDDLDRATAAVVIGAGFIGLEFAAAAARRGIDVTVVEYGPRPLARALTYATTDQLTVTHRAAGIDFQFDVQVSAIEHAHGRVSAVVGHDGRRFPADLVVIGIGADPQTDLAASANLRIDNGIHVDEFLRTSDEHIWAIGDCVSFPCTHAGTRVRRESVQNAVDQARALAATLTGTPTTYRDLPWFWSHQGACKVQIAGAGGPVDRTVLPTDPGTGKFSTFCFRDDILVAVESVNQPAIHLAARKALSAPQRPSLADLTRAGFDLKSLSPARSAAISMG